MAEFTAGDIVIVRTKHITGHKCPHGVGFIHDIKDALEDQPVKLSKVYKHEQNYTWWSFSLLEAFEYKSARAARLAETGWVICGCCLECEGLSLNKPTEWD